MTEFAVVEFVDGVQLVPKLWLQEDNTCYWPKLQNQSKYYKLVVNKEPYNLQWEKYNIISVLAETDTFRKGLAKLKESEIFTDINTYIDEITGRKKRKRIQKGITSSSDENCDDDIEIEKFPYNKPYNKRPIILTFIVLPVSTHFSSLRSHQSSSKPRCYEAIKKYGGESITQLKTLIAKSNNFINRCFAETKIDIHKILENQENILVRLSALEGCNFASIIHNNYVSSFPLKK
ncbi:uncharacterized protein LOC116851375 [Odontomachus brunneus]|uniref:uncharacterized protein LOC116851375 n=1 Tax=Odontomachus brunneus TaxID=486640 RepID=UPI0013F2365B|nr:uncharacterized protein LOC116851375 [Odontomachus brunneus]